MAFNINKVAINFQSNLADIPQFSTKTLEDYSIVSRRHLEKIINNSERRLTEDEHRWLIKRDCKRVITDIKKYIRRRKSNKFLREECKDGNGVRMPMRDVDQCVLNNKLFYPNIAPTVRSILNINSGISADNGDNDFNVIIENNFTVINVQHLNINIHNNDNNCINNNNNNNNNEHIMMFGYDDIGRVENKNNSQVFIMDLEKIYWDKWRDYVKKKNSGIMKRCEKIDSFLSKIQEKLNADQIKNSNMHKPSSRNLMPKQIKTVYDRQQVKIENQKKLLEKQKKEIECLKLQQLKLESEKSMLENQKLLEKTYDKSEKRVKIKNVSRKSFLVKASPSDILNRMEIRALDRQAKWEAIKERRRKMEQEEQKKKQELEEKCIKEQMEQKRKQLFEARENLRLKRIEESKKKIEREIWRENVKIAEDFHRRLLLKKGLDAFKLNLNNVRLQIKKASNFYDKKILGICFSKWRFFVDNNSNEKIYLAEQFYKRNLIKTTFFVLSKILEENKKKEQVAEDWHNFKLQEFWFERWRNYVREINVETNKNMFEAECYHNRTIMKRCFENWRKFPEIIYKERLKDCRLRMWHEKVQEILPDFIPPEF